MSRHVWPASVAILSQLPPPVHGSTAVTQLMVDGFRSHGVAVDLIDRRFSRQVGEVGRISTRKFLAAPSLLLRALRALRRRPEKFIVYLTTRPASFLMDLAVVTLARWHRVPLVGYIHTVGFSDLASRGRVWEWAVRRTLRAFEVVVCLSPSLTLDVAPWVAPHLLRVVPNATPPLANDPVEQSAAPRREYALFVSNLIAGKGISDFIGFARRSAELGRQYEFHAYGYPGDERLVEDAQAATLDPSNNFVFHGPLSSEAKYEVMRGAAILVFPSTYRLEALPLTIVESLSVGTPVIAYNIGGIEDLLREGGGYTFEPNDRDAMFDGLDKLLRDPASRHKLRRAALSNYSSNLTPAAYIARWRDVLADEFESRP